MAVRSIPPIVDYGRMVARLAPRAWMINFTNPVSIITQAVHQETDARLIGICDTPLEMFEDAAHALGLPASVCGYDYFGLNHLGWLRDVLFEGEGQLHRIWNDDAKLMSAYRAPLFEPERLRELKLLPTEYLYYYYRPEHALAKMKLAGSSRGQAVAKLTEEFFQDLRTSGPQDLRTSRPQTSDLKTLSRVISNISPRATRATCSSKRAARRASSPIGPSCPATTRSRSSPSARSSTTRARSFRSTSPNRGTFPFLDDDDIIEVPCRVDANGPQPQIVGPIPDHPRELITRVKELRARDDQGRVDR